MRNHRHFILYTDYVEGVGLDQKGRPDMFSLSVFDSPMGEGEHDELVAVLDWDLLDSWRSELDSRDFSTDRFEKSAFVLFKKTILMRSGRRSFCHDRSTSAGRGAAQRSTGMPL